MSAQGATGPRELPRLFVFGPTNIRGKITRNINYKNNTTKVLVDDMYVS